MKNGIFYFLASLFLIFSLCKPVINVPEYFNQEFRDIEGNRMTLKDHAHEPILILFWDSKCKECGSLVEKAIEALNLKNKDSIFHINVESLNNKEILVKSKENNIQGRGIIDTDLSLVQELEVETNPALVLIFPNKNEIVIHRQYDLQNTDSEIIISNLKKALSGEAQ